MKHVLLVRLVRALQQKPKAFLYLDTHAGRGCYDLTQEAAGDSRSRVPEWPDGVGRLWTAPDAPPAVADYLGIVRAFDRGRGNLAPEARFYPGSPWLVRSLARTDDRLALCEKHPAEFAALQRDFSEPRIPGQPRWSVHEMDGYEAVRAMLPPPERRALVLLDPPYEAEDEFAQITEAIRQGLRRFPTGVFALWYPLTERARVQEFLGGLSALKPPPTLVAELTIAGDDSPRKMKGCGLAVLNPPWRFEADADAVLRYLSRVLAQAEGATGRTTWLVPET